MRLSPTAAFWFLAATLATFLFASSVPSPLYVVYQEEWGFSAIVLTSVFAIYALALLAALLSFGSISDHIGRRPALLGGLVLEIVAMLAFAGAQGVGWLFVARTLQGAATGIAIGAITAALIDLAPPERPWLGPLAGAVSPMTGLAAGALAAGLLVEYGPDPTRFVFWLMVGAFVLALLGARAIPETVVADGDWRSSLRPRIGVPPQLRGAFVASLPSLSATWALGGLILSLGGSLTAGVLGQTSHLIGGLPVFIVAGVSSVVAVLAREASAARTARGGLLALIAGLVISLVSLEIESVALFLLGSAVSGLGFGPAFAGVFRALSSRAPVASRAAVNSTIMVVSYLAFSLPAIIAGVAITALGLRETTLIYGLALIAVALAALRLSDKLDVEDVPALADEEASAPRSPAEGQLVGGRPC